jgi:P27 family predicted phage terminase small subunit
VARGLHEAGLLTQIDRAALAIYCQAWERWVRAEAQVARHGEVVKTIAGNVMQNPYLSIANRSMKQMRDMARELGMTPSARSQIRVQPPEGPSLADLLFERGGGGAVAGGGGVRVAEPDRVGEAANCHQPGALPLAA